MRALAGVLVGLLALLYAPAALAHASLIVSEPIDGGVQPTPPALIALIFNEPVAPLVMRLIGPDGEVLTPTVKSDNETVTLTPPPLRRGSYLVSWRVVSADGHPVGGSLLFSVGEPSARPAGGAQSLGDPAVWAAFWATKVVVFVGLFVGVGGVFFRAWIADSAAPARWLIAVLVTGLVSSLLSIGVQGLDALDLPLSRFADVSAWRTGLATSYGSTALAVAIALTLGLLATVVHAPLLPRGLSLLALLGAGLALALSGHAATAPPRLLTTPSVVVHGVCVAFWVGSLLPLIAAVGSGDHKGALMRFSRAIPYPLAALVASGAALAFVQLDRIDALWTSNYGIILSCKLAAVAALLALAAINRFALTPRFESGDLRVSRPLVTSIAIEFVIALAILAMVALWRFTPPPRVLALANPPVSAHIHGELAMAQIEIEPVRARGAHVRVQVLDGELKPLTVKEVTLVFSNPAAGIEPMRRQTASAGDFTWEIEDLKIPIAGRWHLKVEILISDFEKVVVEDDVELPRSP